MAMATLLTSSNWNMTEMMKTEIPSCTTSNTRFPVCRHGNVYTARSKNLSALRERECHIHNICNYETLLPCLMGSMIGKV